MSVAMVDYDASAKFCAYADPGIKLFGRDIPLKQELSEEPSSISTVQIASHQDDQADSLPQITDCKEPMEIFTCKSEDVSCIEVGNGSVGSTSVKMEEARVKSGFSTHDSLHKAQDIHGSVLQERTTKKPDKLLPCPRCDSLDTKFCYFNNYNVNQPRHFCRKCQRYWTAGGTLRNVPVGAGRRKNKHSALHQKHTMVSDASPVRARTADVARHSFGSTSATVCTALGSFPKPSPSLHVLPLDAQSVPTLDSPLCQSMAVTTLGMQQTGNLQHHGDAHLEGAIPVATKFDAGGGFTAKPRDCTSPVEVLSPSCHANLPLSSASIATTSSEGQQTNNSGCGSEQVQSREITAPSVHGATWQSGTNMMGESAFSLATCPPPNGENTPNSSFSILQPNIFACSNGAPGPFWPGFSWPFMNPAMWGAPPLEWAGPWTMPVYPPGAAAAAAAAAACVLPYSFAGGSPQKHQVIERSQPEKCLWVPKTLRIGDPLNAARSSIWTTLGLGDGPLSSPAHGPTIAFQAKADSKDDDENEAVSTNRMSNPAALSRSAAFQENS